MNLDQFLTNLRGRRLLTTTVMVFTLALGVVIGTLITGAVGAARDQVAPGATPLSIPAPAQLSSSFVQVAKLVAPSVVNINVDSTVKHPAVSPRGRGQGRGQANPNVPNNPDDFQEFFKFFGGQDPTQGGQDMRQQSLGSGIIVDPKGYILTNRHVVNQDTDRAADRIRVKIPNDDTRYEAKVIGEDKDTDLAVIKIEPRKPLTAIKMGNSDGMSVGDWVLAFGSPFGLDATVTAGIISAKDRYEDVFQHFLQTDAAINPGNSGGPLVNMAGEVIGINTAIMTSRGSYEGVGFALPSAMAVKVYNQIIKEGRVTRGSIGINFREDSASSVRAYGGGRDGVLVEAVIPGGPAEKAGLKAADLIVSVAGTPTKNGQELVNKVSETPVGQKVDVRVLRDGKEMTFSVTIGDRASVVDDKPSKEDSGQNPKEQQDARFGIQIQNLNPELASRMGLKEADGVVVTEVDNGSFAEDIGLARGDVILEIAENGHRHPIHNYNDVTNVQKLLKSGDDVAFKVLRRDRTGAPQSFFPGGRLP